MSFASIALHVDSLAEAYGYPEGYDDPTFSEIASRFFEISERYQFRYSTFLRIQDAIAPYTRFVRDQQSKFSSMNENLSAVRNDLRSLRHQVGDPDMRLSPGAVAAGFQSEPPAMVNGKGPLSVGDARASAGAAGRP